MRRNTRLIITVTIISGLLASIGGILANVATSELPASLKPYLQYAWPLLGIVAVAGLISTAVLAYLQTDREHNELPATKQNRQRMLARVYAFWIKGVLEQSLHGAALIALGLKEQPDALANPWHFVFQPANQPERLLPAGTRITQVFDDSGGELLILGEPGSGKTTLLLELAHDLLDRAKQNDTLQMPVIFNLSSWATKKQSMSDWLSEELKNKYQVPRKLAQSWVDTDQLLPLLDGLDEVATGDRVDCVEAINTYRQAHMVPIVVCSRKNEYLNQPKRILLRNAVVVQPLTPQQIDDYLSSAGGQLAALRVALREDEELHKLATTPLMLSVLTLAYQEKSVEDILTSDSREVQQQHVFATYVQKMLLRRSLNKRYLPQQTIHWLSWLAKQMSQQNQNEFYIERMQPDCLPGNRSQRFYKRIVKWSIIGLLTGLMALLCIGLFIIPLFDSTTTLIYQIIIITFWGFTLPFGIFSSEVNEIDPAEVIAFSWEGMLRSSYLGLGFGLMGILLITLCSIPRFLIDMFSMENTLHVNLFNLFPNVLLLYLAIGIIVWVSSGLIGGLIGGLSSHMRDKHSILKPNQGIWNSAWNGVFVGLLSGLVLGLSALLLLSLLNWLHIGISIKQDLILAISFAIALFSGSVGGFLVGGLPFIQHFTLRFVLWRTKSLPWNYSQFLDYAAERILLRKVGGSYIFIHRLLLDYFASLDSETAADATRT